jgi:stage II sporulation protein M
VINVMLIKEKIKAFYAGGLEDLYGARKYIYSGVAVYAAGLLFGLVFPGRFEVFLDSFSKLAAKFAGRSVPVLIFMIFLQNFFASFVSMWAGALFGLVPVAAAATNGILLGVVLSVAAHGNFGHVLWKLIPHGIFEMPAVFISWGLGIWRGTWLFRRRRETTFRERAAKAYRIFFAMVVPLLLLAAIIEGIGITYWRNP